MTTEFKKKLISPLTYKVVYLQKGVVGIQIKMQTKMYQFWQKNNCKL
jgi:hypothetical protein